MSDGAGRLWGGRFRRGVDTTVDAFTRSFGFDRRLAQDDVTGSLAHAQMLRERGLVDESDGRALVRGLAGLHGELCSGALRPEGDYEDVHAWIEATLTARVGEAGRRLHTGRSRNDQVATALRLHVRRRLTELVGAACELALAWRRTAGSHVETLLPGYTHLQRGQPVSLAHHLLAHGWSLLADAERFRRAWRTSGTSPLGAAALAGTPHAIAPERSAELLGFERVFANSMHAVADRDYVLESSFACALAMIHLSRWAEEVVLWTSREFGFAELDDSVAKGSSIMPQKRNPEPAEVLRGKAGRVVGDLMAHLMQLKGLALTYNSDLQEDKEALFDALDQTAGGLGVARVLHGGLVFRADAMAAALQGGFVTATDLADDLVRRGSTFRDAHAAVGAAVARAEERGVELWELSAEDLRELHPDLGEETLAALRPAASLRAHRSPGGPAPDRVRTQLEQFDATARELVEWREGLGEPPILELARRELES